MAFNPIKEFSINFAENPQLYNALQGIDSEDDFFRVLNNDHEILGIFLSNVSTQSLQSNFSLIERAFTLVTPFDCSNWPTGITTRIKKAQLSLDLKKSMAKLIKENVNKTFPAQEDQLRQNIVGFVIEYFPQLSIRETMEKTLQFAKEAASQMKMRPTRLEIHDLIGFLITQIPNRLASIIEAEKKEDQEFESANSDFSEDFEKEFENDFEKDFEMDDYYSNEEESEEQIQVEIPKAEIPEEKHEKEISQVKEEFNLLIRALKLEIVEDPTLKSALDETIAAEFKRISEIFKVLSSLEIEEYGDRALHIEEKFRIILQMLFAFELDAKDNKMIAPCVESMQFVVKGVLETVFLPCVRRFYIEEPTKITFKSSEQFHQLNSLMCFMKRKLSEKWGITEEMNRIKPRVNEVIRQMSETTIGFILDSEFYEKSHRDALSAISLLQGFIDNKNGMIDEFLDTLQPILDSYRNYINKIQDPDDLIFDAILLHVRGLIVDAVKKLEIRLQDLQIDLGSSNHVKSITTILGSIQSILGTEIKLEMKMETKHDVLIALLFNIREENDDPNAMETARNWVDRHQYEYDLISFESWLSYQMQSGANVDHLEGDLQTLYALFVGERG